MSKIITWTTFLASFGDFAACKRRFEWASASEVEGEWTPADSPSRHCKNCPENLILTPLSSLLKGLRLKRA